jgi:hypothetical protein
VYPYTRSGHEGLPIEQHLTDLFVTPRGPDAVRLQPDHGPGLAQLVMKRVRVGEDLRRIEVHVHRGYTRSCKIVSVGTSTCWLRHYASPILYPLQQIAPESRAGTYFDFRGIVDNAASHLLILSGRRSASATSRFGEKLTFPDIHLSQIFLV